MANNRMYLVHKESGKAILLAKYYPSTGWYVFHEQEFYDSFFDTSKRTGTFGDTGYCIRFEHDEVAQLVGNEIFPFNRGKPE